MPNDPSPLEHDGVFDGIIDLYGENHFELDRAYDLGVRAIIHRASIGTSPDHDPDRYRTRRDQAVAKGMKWGAFHFLTKAPVDAQLDTFLGIEDGRDPAILMAVDWEGAHPPSYQHLLDFVTGFRQRLGYSPMLYAGNLVREQAEIVEGRSILRDCPLWYARYGVAEAALEIPTRTWATYTLWQFASEKRQSYERVPPGILEGADFNRYHGGAAALEAAWPFH